VPLDSRNREEKDDQPGLFEAQLSQNRQWLTSIVQPAGIKSDEPDVPLDFPENGYHNAFRGPESGVPMIKSFDLQKAASIINLHTRARTAFKEGLLIHRYNFHGIKTKDS
jgi:hypothetical protein